ncbi:MAG TPA: GH25 family lysozyme [Ideonella sp.]|uniref:glycoside hydrolase family 25 protein n=1 Tax=Ideonella sp. TaxID=1929293 RepID=UPI002BC1C55B|nr:GH25 family lysozyme [Ideonella sp.]HSI50492.1 GH25 family lysozyme [Ideonella sp.]
MPARHRFAALLLAACLAACDKPSPDVAASGQPAQAGVTAPAPADAGAPIAGIDLSNWQGGAVDFSHLKAAGKSFVFIKATQGASVVDPDHAGNLQRARAAGIPVGSYHFYVTSDTPDSQFANFSAQVSALQPGDLPPVVDIEVLSKQSLPGLSADLQRLLTLMAQRYGVKPVVYTGESFASEYLAGFSAYPLWLAEYSGNPAPKLPLDWSQWTFWQYSQSGTVEGITGAVDLSRFNGTPQQFDRLRVPPAP